MGSCKYTLCGAGKDEVDQVHKIFSLFGRPTEKKWPGVTSLLKYVG